MSMGSIPEADGSPFESINPRGSNQTISRGAEKPKRFRMGSGISGLS